MRATAENLRASSAALIARREMTNNPGAESVFLSMIDSILESIRGAEAAIARLGRQAVELDQGRTPAAGA